jgi:hypothetical protein
MGRMPIDKRTTHSMGPVFVAKLQTKPPSRIHDSGALDVERVRDLPSSLPSL